MISMQFGVSDTDATQTYRTLAQVESAFEAFLARYIDSHFNGITWKLIEVGNIHAPPDPDMPVVSESSPMASEMGSW